MISKSHFSILATVLLLPLLDEAAPAGGIADAATLVQERKYDEAIAVYDSIIKSGLGATVHEARFRKGLCLKARKQYAEAIACWEILLKPGFINPYRKNALLETASTFAFELNQYDAALKLYAKFFKDFPLDDRMMEARYQECGVYYRQGKYEQAKAGFDKFLTDFPDSYLCSEVRKMIGLCQNELVGTRHPSEPTAQKTPEPTLLMRSSVNPVKKARLVKDSSAELDKAVAAAESLFDSGQFERALQAYLKIRKDFPFSARDEWALFRTGGCYAQTGQDKKAIAAWNEIVLKARGRPESEHADDSLLALGDLYLHSRDEPEKAMTYYQSLRETMSESELIDEAEHQLGLIYFYQRNTKEALMIFEKERAKSPADTNAPPDSLTRLIEACRGERCYVPEFNETPKGRQAATHIRRGDVFFTAKEYAKAKKAYEQAVRSVPGTEDAAYALMQAGRCYLQLLDARNAIKCYRPFLKQYAGSQWADDALIRAAVIYVGQLGDKKAGVEILETLVARYPDGGQADLALSHLAMLAMWDKDWKKAGSIYQALLERYPDSDFGEYVKTVALAQLDKFIAGTGRK